jgi:hypothetical protein
MRAFYTHSPLHKIGKTLVKPKGRKESKKRHKNVDNLQIDEGHKAAQGGYF